MAYSKLLKKDLFGEIRLATRNGEQVVIRDCAPASPWLRWLARWLMRREASALAALDGTDGIPDLLSMSDDRLTRSYIEGAPLQHARPTDPAYFAAAAHLLRRLHRLGVAHNDLAKEPNILVCSDGSPGILDFQLAMTVRHRSFVYRLAAREDLRHLLKHKRYYCPERLTARERRILATPGMLSRAWALIIKPVYLCVTRRLLGWADREGANDRGNRA